MRGKAGSWWLPLLAGLVPLVATTIAFQLSVRGGFISSCNPFLEGCTSISAAARNGDAKVVFTALVLPSAVLQALCWMRAPAWLREEGAANDRWQRALPVLGACAALALVAYVGALGLEGDGWRWVRRVSVPLYFGLTCIAMLVVSGRAGLAAPLRACCLALPVLGIVHLFLPLAIPVQKDALENASEWWAGAVFTAFFLALAWAWRRRR